MESSRWLDVLMSQIWTLPYIFAFSMGILLSLILWWRHPGVSSFAALGFLILLGNMLIGTGLTVWLISAQESAAAGDIGRWLRISAGFRAMFSLVGYVFLFVAIFGWRSKERK